MDAIQIIQNVGFPIAMCLFFMFRIEKKLDKLTDAIYSLSSKDTPN